MAVSEYAIEVIRFLIGMVARLARTLTDSHYRGVAIRPSTQIPCKQVRGQHIQSNRLILKRDLGARTGISFAFMILPFFG